MSQKVNPHALRSQNQLNYQASTSNHEIFFSEPKQSKWGLNSYSRIFHEDQTIETYLEGFFRSFGFYQKTCVIERKCNKTVHVTAYVLRTPQTRTNPNAVHRTMKEKVLQEGLDKGWLPSLLLQTMAQIMDSSWWNNQTSTITKQKQITEIKDWQVQLNEQPMLTPIISSAGDSNSLLQQQTEESRFKSYWKNFATTSGGNHKAELLKQSDTKSNRQGATVNPSWWSHRSWHTKIVRSSYSTVDSYNQSIDMKSSSQVNNNILMNNLLFGVKDDTIDLTLSIVPVNSLADSSKLIADYMADKIEQSTPLQGLFQEIVTAIKTESLLTNDISLKGEQSSIDLKEANTPTVGSGSTKPIIGFKLSCSGRIQKNAYAKPAEMADSLTITEGLLPLNSFKHNIEFTQTSSTNAFGTCGIKVWINRAT